LNKAVEKTPSVELSTLSQTHEIIPLIRQINMAASQFLSREDLSLWFAQKLVQSMFKMAVPLGLEIYILLLERVCEASKRVAKELATWLIFSDDEVPSC
jgi:CCR4-NOT transcription complex subunit 1